MDEIGLSTGLMAFHPEIVGNTEIRAFDPFNPLPSTYTSSFFTVETPFLIMSTTCFSGLFPSWYLDLVFQ